MLNLATVVETNARLYPDKPALITEQSRVTHGALNAFANQVANSLLELGVRPGDRVALTA